MEITYQAPGFKFADVEKRYIRCIAKDLYKVVLVNAKGRTIQEQTLGTKDLYMDSAMIAKTKADALAGKAFSFVEWPLNVYDLPS